MTFKRYLRRNKGKLSYWFRHNFRPRLDRWGWPLVMRKRMRAELADRGRMVSRMREEHEQELYQTLDLAKRLQNTTVQNMGNRYRVVVDLGAPFVEHILIWGNSQTDIDRIARHIARMVEQELRQIIRAKNFVRPEGHHNSAFHC